MSADEATRALRDEFAPQPLIDSSRAFNGHIWNIDAETFTFGESELRREVMTHPGAVAVLVGRETERGTEILLINQYRQPVRSRLWELPAGLLDIAEESPLSAAQRELAEEVDLQAQSWSVLIDILTSPGGSSESIRVFYATQASEIDAFARAEEEAEIERRWVLLDDAVQAVLAREIHNSITVTAILSFAAAQSRGVALADANVDWPFAPQRLN
ncbi:NUDIX domain-containing protein [Humidisolicoccus flavus]|uniref:NUDIX domain-containing protein n=1 Tax=Humidisolicoccus flavus TaxID=3111414 RepID=UPI00324B88C2